MTARLVQLDVTVLDKNGKPVDHLSRSDFTIADGGELQTIHTFESFSPHTLALPASQIIHNTGELQRLAPNAPVTILVLDELNTEFADTAFARTSIRKYLQAQSAVLSQPTSLLIADDDGFHQQQDFTQDRDQLLGALVQIPASYPFGMMRTAGSREGIAIRFAQTLASLQQVAQATIGHTGRKNIIWIGRGFPALDLRNEPAAQAQLVEGAAERTVNLLQQAHITVFTIDPTLSTKFATALNVDQTQTDPAAFAAETHDAKNPFDGTISFNTIAPETGGRAVALTNDIDREISTSVTEGNEFYTISYVPTADVNAANPYRQIRIRVDRPGLTVVTRQGYFGSESNPPVARSEQQARKAEGFDLGAAITSDMTFTGLGIFAVSSQANVGSYIIQVNTRDIAWQAQTNGSTTAKLTLVAIALDGKRKPV